MYTETHITLRVPDVELIYLLREFILLNGFSARHRKGEAPFEVLHPVHDADVRPLQHTTHEERGEKVGMDTKKCMCIINILHKKTIEMIQVTALHVKTKTPY